MYLRLLMTSVMSQMQYKVSFLINVLAQFLVTGIEIAGVWALFTRFGALPDWTFAEVCLFYGIVNVAFAIADGLSAGFDRFGVVVDVDPMIQIGHNDPNQATTYLLPVPLPARDELDQGPI